MPDITLRQLREFFRAVDAGTWVGDGSVWIAADRADAGSACLSVSRRSHARDPARQAQGLAPMNDARRSTQRRPEGADIQDLPRRYDKARSAVAQRGFDADMQTKISLFVGATRSSTRRSLAPSSAAGAGQRRLSVRARAVLQGARIRVVALATDTLDDESLDLCRGRRADSAVVGRAVEALDADRTGTRPRRLRGARTRPCIARSRPRFADDSGGHLGDRIPTSSRCSASSRRTAA